MVMPRHGCSLAVDTLLKLSKKRPLLFKYCSMLLIQHGLHHAWKNGFQRYVTLNVDLRPPSTCVCCQYCWQHCYIHFPPLIVRHSAWCPCMNFLTMPVLYRKGGTYTELSQGWALCLHFVVSAWCCTQKRISRLCLGQVPVQRMLVFHCICIVLYSEKTFSPVFGPSSGAERLNAKNIWDEDHDAILEEIGTGEKVLIMMRKHHLVMHLGMDHHHHHQRMATIKCRIVSSHRN